MGRLTNMPSMLSALSPLVARQTDAEGHSRTLEPLRHLYSTAAWRALRLRVFERDGFRCRHCAQLEGDTSKLVADHIEPHRGDLALFWDEANIQTLWKPCHDRFKQALEHRQRHPG